MPANTSYTKVYKKWSANPKPVHDMIGQVKRGAFYQIVEYKYVEDADDSKTWSSTTAPIVYTLYASKKDDLLHCVKLSYINPITVKQLFKKLIDEKDAELDPGRNARSFYNNNLSEIKYFTTNFYRTYKLSGIVRAIEIEMDITKLVPKNFVKNGSIAAGYKTYGRRGNVQQVQIFDDKKLKGKK